MGLLSGLGSLGLGNIEKMDLFQEEDKKQKVLSSGSEEVKRPQEEEFIFDKQLVCPVCDKKIAVKIAKSGRAKLIASDLDLRPQYEFFDSSKYDTVVCESCGYSALTRYHKALAPSQVKAIRENISKSVNVTRYRETTYSYEQALERYRLCLACAMVKKAKNSEKAYICLKMAWLLRGYVESGELDKEEEKKQGMKDLEQESLRNAYTGFLDARQNESFPMCGMDEMTMDYLIAAIAYEINEMEAAARMVQSILVSNVASKRVKERALYLKDLIIEARKKA